MLKLVLNVLIKFKTLANSIFYVKLIVHEFLFYKLFSK
jgi:hypothetical protein